MLTPASSAACKIVAPSSALIGLPSMVRVFAAIKLSGCHRRGLRLPFAAGRRQVAGLQQFLVLVPEKPQRAERRVGGGLAEAAEARVPDHVAKLLELRNVPGGGLAFQDF